MVLQQPEPEPVRVPGLVRIRPASWCLDRLRAVTPGLLRTVEAGPRRGPLPVLCVVEHDDVVFVASTEVERTWSLVWTAVTIVATGRSEGGRRWLVRASGSCERTRLPLWAARAWSEAAHPARGGAEVVPTPPIGLRLRSATVRGYSVQPPERWAG